jgi:hypothetical protein
MTVSRLLIGLLPLALIVLPEPSMAAAGDSSYAGRSLRASTAPAWNPPTPERRTATATVPAHAPVPATELWESVLRFPGQVVSLPLTALNYAAEKSLIFVEQGDILARAALIMAREGALGITIAPASLGDRTGLGGEVRWQPPQVGRHLFADVAGTTSQYNREHFGALAGPFTATYTSEWRPREPYFGPGLGAPRSGASAYAARWQSAILLVTWPPDRPGPSQGFESLVATAPKGPVRPTQLSAWVGPRVTFMTNGRDPDRPSFEVAHPAEAAGSIDRRVEHLIYGARLSHDARSGMPHWSRGWRASVDAERYDKSMEALAIKDAHSDARSFTRMTYRAEAGASFGRDPRTLRLAVTAVDQRLDEGGGTFLLSDLVSLGGSAGIAGFDPGRFRDLDLVVAKLSYIYPLVKNLEFDLHTETGGVYPDLSRARVTSFESSFGAALRFRTEFAPFATVGYDWSSEGSRLRFSIGGVE